MIKVEITKSDLAAIGRNAFREIGRQAMKASINHWVQTFLPLHFTNVAYLRYRYARRDKRTDRLKSDRKPWPFGEHTQNAIGEVKPLVFSGHTRQTATNPRVETKAPNYETYEASAVMNAPAFNFGAGKRIDMRDEVTRVTPQEERTLEKVFAQEFENQLIARGRRAPRKTRRIAA